jgi:hypothetical protein
MNEQSTTGDGFQFRTGMVVPDRMGEMARRIEELERTVADLTRHNDELRETVRALLNPLPRPTNAGNFW